MHVVKDLFRKIILFSDHILFSCLFFIPNIYVSQNFKNLRRFSEWPIVQYYTQPRWQFKRATVRDISTKCAIFQLLNFNTIHYLYEPNLVFCAPAPLTAFGARTFLMFSHQKWISTLSLKFCNVPQPVWISRRPLWKLFIAKSCNRAYRFLYISTALLIKICSN
jgi:hypothetical protein